MRALILAAGYATRMYPLTAERPKSLLPVGRRVVLDWMLELLQRLEGITELVIVTNAKFAPHFHAWSEQRSWEIPVRFLNDGSTAAENRLGAIRDIAFAVDRLGTAEPWLVTAGDHIIEWNVRRMAQFGHAHAPHATMALYTLPDLRAASRFGVVQVDATQRVIHCEEKPRHPRSNLAMICLYYLPPQIAPRLREYLAIGRRTDAPGHFFVWLSRREPVYGWSAEGKYFDIGTIASYHAACAALTEGGRP